VFVCRGYSKTLGAQSWRLGYAVSHPDTIKDLMTHHDPIYIRYAIHAFARMRRQRPRRAAAAWC
jgi:histidinol-phosphate/aromatic aminotransferase/cobyric acid decarboxylase-like protein